jgi:hypothetical protein
MDVGNKASATVRQQGPVMPLTLTAFHQQNLKENNMLDGNDDATSQNIKQSKLTLVNYKADNDNISNLSNKNCDKIHNKNTENRRLLGTSGLSEKKIVIVPSVRQGTAVSTNGVKLNLAVPSTGNRDSPSVNSRPIPNGGISKTEDPKFQNKNGTGNGGLRSPQFVTGLELPGLEESIRAGHTLPFTMSSLRSLKLEEANGHQPIATSPGPNWRSSYCFSEVASHMSVRSLASIGMGSTDGRKVTIRRVPTSPTELFNIVHSPT